MVSTITQRTGAAVSGVSVSQGSGIIQTTNVSGTNAILCDSTPEIDTYETDSLYLLRPFAINTAAVTVNINSVGIKSWMKPNGLDYATGELSPDLDYLVKYNGTHFRTVSPF